MKSSVTSEFLVLGSPPALPNLSIIVFKMMGFYLMESRGGIRIYFHTRTIQKINKIKIIITTSQIWEFLNNRDQVTCGVNTKI